MKKLFVKYAILYDIYDLLYLLYYMIYILMIERKKCIKIVKKVYTI